jgi:hypothetical protein
VDTHQFCIKFHFLARVLSCVTHFPSFCDVNHFQDYLKIETQFNNFFYYRVGKEEHYKRSRLQQKSLQRLSRRLTATSDFLEACRVAAEEVLFLFVFFFFFFFFYNAQTCRKIRSIPTRARHGRGRDAKGDLSPSANPTRVLWS